MTGPLRIAGTAVPQMAHIHPNAKLLLTRNGVYKWVRTLSGFLNS